MTFEDRYTLQVPLGESVRGTLWSGKDEKFKRAVVVAMVDEDAPSGTAERFVEQWAKVTEVRHPSLVRVFETGTNDDDVPFAVIELVEGETLAARMAKGSPLRLDNATRAIVDVADALGALHAAGLAHGDVEPANVLVRERGGRVVPKLVGLGLDRALIRSGAQPLDDADHLVTLAYMSPAQARGEVVADASSDAYSLAAMFYALLTGRLPHHGETEAELRAAVASESVPKVARVRPELAGPIADVIDEALAEDPASRFEDATALSKALRTALLKSRKPGELETIVGARALRAPPLPAEEVEAPTQKMPAKDALAVEPPTRKMPPKGALPSRRALPSKEAPAAAATPEPARDEDASKDDGPADAPAESAVEDLEFERLSGLLDISVMGEPKRIGAPPPPPSKKLPPPSPRGKAAAAEGVTKSETAGEPEVDDEPGALASDGQTDDAVAASAVADAAPEASSDEDVEAAASDLVDEPSDADEEPVAPILAASTAAAPASDAAPALSMAAVATDDDAPIPAHAVDDADEALPRGALPMWVWGVAAAAALGLVIVGAVALGGGEETPTASIDAPGEAPPVEVEAPSEEVAPSGVDVEELAATDPALDEAAEGEAPLEEGAEAALDEPVEEELAEEPVVEPVVVTLAGIPEGAEVLLDGEPVDAHTLELAPDSGEHSVAVRLEGHRAWERTLEAAESQTIEVELEAEEARPAPRASARRAARARARRAAARSRSSARANRRSGRANRRGRSGRSGRPTAVSDPGF